MKPGDEDEEDGIEEEEEEEEDNDDDDEDPGSMMFSRAEPGWIISIISYENDERRRWGEDGRSSIQSCGRFSEGSVMSFQKTQVGFPLSMWC